MTLNSKQHGCKNVYESEYLEWKTWSDEFGKLASNQRKYFDNELKKIRLNEEGEVRVLEIGFGNGEFLEYCKSRGWKIEGLEINSKLIARANDKGYFVKQAKCIDEYEAKHFDIVAAFDVLEHLDAMETLEIFKSINRILKENGVLILRFPNGDSPFGLKNQNGDITHKQSIGMGKIKYYSKSTGFEILYLDKPAYIIWDKNIKKIIHGVLIMPCINLLNILIKYVFYQGEKINFFSQNLTAILRPLMKYEPKNKNR